MTTLCSVVSHNQNALLAPLLSDLAKAQAPADFCVLVTQNTPDDQTPLQVPPGLLNQGRFAEYRNNRSLGFGANHNQAFAFASQQFPGRVFDRFCVLNPDIRMDPSVLIQLGEALADHPEWGLVAPNILSSRGETEDFARYRPTLGRLLRKLMRHDQGRFPSPPRGPYQPDWFAGMFMLFDAACYARIGGFDESYFMYYEDVEICIRARRMGYRPTVFPACEVVHLAQRSSHRDLRLASHHLRSMARFLLLGERGRGSLPGRLHPQHQSTV